MRYFSKIVISIGVLLIVTQALVLFWFGQPIISASGVIQFWNGNVLSLENSQQISDWYTFSHIIHGFLFYFFLGALFPRMSIGIRLLIALGIEIGWEITENTPWLIEKYRQQALAVGYSGDSILNSISDSIAMIVGFLLARKIPILATIVIGVTFELFVGYMIHDNLTLNILNFIYPMDFITQWQSGV